MYALDWIHVEIKSVLDIIESYSIEKNEIEFWRSFIYLNKHIDGWHFARLNFNVILIWIQQGWMQFQFVTTTKFAPIGVKGGDFSKAKLPKAQRTQNFSWANKPAHIGQQSTSKWQTFFWIYDQNFIFLPHPISGVIRKKKMTI